MLAQIEPEYLIFTGESITKMAIVQNHISALKKPRAEITGAHQPCHRERAADCGAPGRPEFWPAGVHLP